MILLACHRSSGEQGQAAKRDGQGGRAVSAASRAPAAAAPEASNAQPRPSATTAASSLSGPPITPDQLKRYQAALGAGRLATQRKDAPAAERAFGDALLAIPDDARAHSERGYARLLHGDLAGADADFDKAFGASRDPKLIAQVWFNRGLVAERNGNAETARNYYAYSYQLNPTAAARNKLNGKTLCPAGATRIEGRDFPNWLAVWNELSRQNATEYRRGEPQPTEDAAVRATYGVDACSSLCVGFAESDRNLHAFLQLENGAVRVFRDVYEQSGGRCESTASVERRGAVIDITTTGWEVDMDCSEDACRTFCGGPGEWRSASLLLEPNEKKRLLVVTRAGANEQNPDPHVVSAAGGARVEAQGCSDVFPFSE